VLAVLPPSAIPDPSAWVVVAELVREGWLAGDGAWLLSPTPVDPGDLDGGTVCTLEDHAPEVFTAWLAASSAAVDTAPVSPELSGCDAVVSGHHGERDALQARAPEWAVAQITGPPAVLLVAPSAHDAAVEPARAALTALPRGVFGDDVVAVRLARGPLTLPPLELAWIDPGRPAPEPSIPAPPPPAPVPTATVRVRTIGGPAGTYTLDGSPPTPTGWRTPTVVPAGHHDLRVFPGGSSEAAFQQSLELQPDEEVRICVDLSTGGPC
jgi:hypothetical protein